MAVAVSVTGSCKVYYGLFWEVSQALSDDKIPAHKIVSIKNDTTTFYAFVKLN